MVKGFAVKNEAVLQEAFLAEVKLRHLGKHCVVLEPALANAVCEELLRRMPVGLIIVKPEEPGREHQFYFSGALIAKSQKNGA